MITFLVCLVALVVSYFTYGRYLEKICGINPANPVPSQTMYDGVDYLPMPRWKVFLIQLLNIAGLGPIFGALLGAAYGPVAFLWITLGGIFMGAMHDFVAGVISLKNNGLSLPEIIGKYLGNGTRTEIRRDPRRGTVSGIGIMSQILVCRSAAQRTQRSPLTRWLSAKLTGGENITTPQSKIIDF